MARKTKEDADATRRAIQRAALNLFSTRGVAETTLSDVAKQAGVTRGAIYWHFENKEALLRSLETETMQPYEQLALEGERPDEPDPLGKLKASLTKTFIGFKTHYVTPVADPRLNLKRHFTLARALDAESDGEPFDLYVLQNPVDSPLCDKTRILKFGGELLSYEGFTTEPPYRFTGVRRGHFGTNLVAHPYGEIGGVLDVCEFGATSCYIDQETDLQDEIAAKIARIYNAGFEFMYCDGSEGVNVPGLEASRPEAEVRGGRGQVALRLALHERGQRLRHLPARDVQGDDRALAAVRGADHARRLHPRRLRVVGPLPPGGQALALHASSRGDIADKARIVSITVARRRVLHAD